MSDFISDLMGFDPSDLSVFKPQVRSTDPNIYKPNPKDSKDEDGSYRARLKIIYNPLSPQDSIVNQATYWLSSADGSRSVKSSLSIGDKSCPIFRSWKRHHFSGDPARDAFAKQVYEKRESCWVLIQVIEDKNKPELTGKFMFWKLPKDILTKLRGKTNPSTDSNVQPYPVLDYVVGLALNLVVTPGPDDPSAPERKQREISYTLSEFGDYETCIATDGTPLLTEEEVELVDAYVTARDASTSAKTAKKREDGAAEVARLRPVLVDVYKKVINYVKDNARCADGTPADLATYCGYQPWDADTAEFVRKWVEIADAQIDPKTMTYEEFKTSRQPAAQAPEQVAPAPDVSKSTASVLTPTEDGLPF